MFLVHWHGEEDSKGVMWRVFCREGREKPPASECPVYSMKLRMEQVICLHGFVGQQGQLYASLSGTARGSLCCSCCFCCFCIGACLCISDLSSEVAADKSSWTQSTPCHAGLGSEAPKPDSPLLPNSLGYAPCPTSLLLGRSCCSHSHLSNLVLVVGQSRRNKWPRHCWQLLHRCWLTPSCGDSSGACQTRGRARLCVRVLLSSGPPFPKTFWYH